MILATSLPDLSTFTQSDYKNYYHCFFLLIACLSYLIKEETPAGHLYWFPDGGSISLISGELRTFSQVGTDWTMTRQSVVPHSGRKEMLTMSQVRRLS